jgi:hypothetical protein
MTKREGKKSHDIARAGLSSYLCRLCPMCVNLSRAGVVSTPPQYVMGMHLIGMHLIGVNNMGGGEITV